jgi:hypothetical protein
MLEKEAAKRASKGMPANEWKIARVAQRQNDQ